MLKDIEKLRESINKCLLLEEALGVDMALQIEELKEQLNRLIKGF